MPEVTRPRPRSSYNRSEKKVGANVMNVKPNSWSAAPPVWALALAAVMLAAPALPAADDASAPFVELRESYVAGVRPLAKQFCLDCHSTEAQEGELDLEQFAALDDVRRGTKTWLKVAEMLDNGEMPPKDAEQPTADQRKQLRDWIARYLDAEALASAGDPGPVALRRLNNAQYTYTMARSDGRRLAAGPRISGRRRRRRRIHQCRARAGDVAGTLDQVSRRGQTDRHARGALARWFSLFALRARAATGPTRSWRGSARLICVTPIRQAEHKSIFKDFRGKRTREAGCRLSTTWTRWSSSARRWPIAASRSRPWPSERGLNAQVSRLAVAGAQRQRRGSAIRRSA